jgi:outer membrane protein TolC
MKMPKAAVKGQTNATKINVFTSAGEYPGNEGPAIPIRRMSATTFATHGIPEHSKLRVNVANFFQIRLSVTPATRQGVNAMLLTLALMGTAQAQGSSSLPMAPSAIRAALPEAPAPAKPAESGALEFQTAGTPQLHFSGNVPVPQATSDPLPLGLDDAIDRALKGNLQVLLATQTEQAVRGQILSVFYNLLPNMRATAYTNAEEIDLAAMGFKPSSLAAFGFAPGTVSTIVKIDTTSAQLSANQVLFNLPDFYLYAAARKAANVVTMNTLNERGGVVLAVGTQYLAALADQAEIANAEALVTADEEVLRQATLSHDAGVGTNVDVLRARVQLQSEQQTLIKDQNAFAKDKIALNRLIGLPADQELTLIDTVPYANLAELPLDQAKALAYRRRKDLLALEAELEVAERARKAVRYERIPSLAFNGYYGVLGETHGLYHGVFTAQGVLKIPIFEEARFRGEAETTAAQEIGLKHQIDSLRVTIDAQIRTASLDVESSAELVKVARSNVDLASQALSDTRDRFAAGVDDNLPVVQAQATLATAQSRLIATQFQYNQAKLNLARNTGVVETEYKQYLGRQ